MSSNREEFLARVRQAVAEGNRAGGSPVLPERGSIGYQGGGDDPVQRLGAELAAAGGKLHVVANGGEALARVVQLVHQAGARRVLLGGGAFVDERRLQEELAAAGVEVAVVSQLSAGEDRATFFAADVGISGVDALLAETGTLVLATQPDQPRAVSLLPPVHIAVASTAQIIPDLFDLLAPTRWPTGLPACLSLITGPSKTGDIELKLVTGVHGPGEVHLVLVPEVSVEP